MAKHHDDRPSEWRVSRRDVLRGIGAAAVTLGAAKAGLAKAASITASTSTQPVRFALLGDWGDGEAGQFAIGERMAKEHAARKLDLIVSAGDNIYPNGAPEYFGEKFERPFAPVLEQGLPFYTVLGNHDVRKGASAQMRYPLFNMKGRSYYSVQAGNGTIELFMLDSNDFDARQAEWLDRMLGASTAMWKVPVFHHPIYSAGRHGSDGGLRRKLEPILTRHRVAVAFSGHDHIYQRVVPQGGVQYFVSGAGGKIRKGDIDQRDRLVAKGYDDGTHFMVLEADSTSFRYAAVTASGERVDEGAIDVTVPVATLGARASRAHAGGTPRAGMRAVLGAG